MTAHKLGNVRILILPSIGGFYLSLYDLWMGFSDVERSSKGTCTTLSKTLHVTEETPSR